MLERQPGMNCMFMLMQLLHPNAPPELVVMLVTVYVTTLVSGSNAARCVAAHAGVAALALTSVTVVPEKVSV